MAAFFLAEIESIHDRDKYDQYIERVASVIRKFGGEYVLRSDRLVPVSGSWTAKRVILIRFRNKERLQSCFQSDEYAQIAYLREQSTVSKAVIIEQ